MGKKRKWKLTAFHRNDTSYCGIIHMWITSDARGIKAEVRGESWKNKGRKMQLDAALISFDVEACDCVL